jgi:translation initiation factor 2 subunit 2
LSDEEYMKLLDRAFEGKPALAASTSDFVIPNVDSFVQGNKTIIKNIAAIADKARRKPEEIGRYISKELSVPISIDEQKRLTVNSKFNAPDLDKIIKRYFSTYVICKECSKPDTRLDSSGRGMFTLVCEACGAHYKVKSY